MNPQVYAILARRSETEDGANKRTNSQGIAETWSVQNARSELLPHHVGDSFCSIVELSFRKRRLATKAVNSPFL